MFFLSQSAPCLTTNILFLATHVLSKSDDLIYFRVINIFICTNFNIRKNFYFIFDKIDYHMYLIIFLNFFQRIVGLIFHVFVCLFVFFTHNFLYCFPHSFYFLLYLLNYILKSIPSILCFFNNFFFLRKFLLFCSFYLFSS